MTGSSARSDPQKTEDAVAHRQNNSYVKAVGTSPLRSSYSVVRSCCFNCCAEQSHKDNVHSAAVGQLFRV